MRAPSPSCSTNRVCALPPTLQSEQVVSRWRMPQGLTIREAAASHDTLVAIAVAIIAGGLTLFPPLILLLRPSLGGRARSP
jgi:hypothetical protein